MSVTVVKKRGPGITDNNTQTAAHLRTSCIVRVKRNSPRFQRKLERLMTRDKGGKREREYECAPFVPEEYALVNIKMA